MIRIPLHVHRKYQELLAGVGVSSKQFPHYVKWVRYYLDYASKYGASNDAERILKGFIKKLASKGQSVSLQRQARRAVSIYLQMVPADALDPNSPLPEPKVSDAKAARATPRRSLEPEGMVSADWSDLVQRLEGEIQRRDYSPRTLSTYSIWVQKFARFINYIPVDSVSDTHATAFLTDLAVEHKVVASTQNQAFNALLFLFRHVLNRDYDLKDRVVRAKQSKYIPVVLTREEVDAVLNELEHPFDLIVSVLYGCGLRVADVGVPEPAPWGSRFC